MVTIEKIFDLSADSLEKTEEKRFEEVTLETIRATKKYLKPDDVVLDIGCATGNKTIEYAPHIRKIYGIDISSKMIGNAIKKTSEMNVANVEFIKTSVFDMRFDDRSFDVITANAVLHLFENPEKEMKRIYDLLKPGGLFISLTPCLKEKMDFSNRSKFFLVRMLMSIHLFPEIKQFTRSALYELIRNEKFEWIESRVIVHEMTAYFIVAKKL